MKANEKSVILIVDDSPEIISSVSQILKHDYLVRAAISGQVAIEYLNSNSADLILLDIMMPNMSGYEVCKKLKLNPETRDIPVIFLTSKSSDDDEAKGLHLGAVDYITKPINSAILRERVFNHLELKRSRDLLMQQNQNLENQVRERTQLLSKLQDVAMVAMGALAEARDPETGNHIRRTQHYIKILARRLCRHYKFRTLLTEENITRLFKSAPLHDIGKVGIPDHILLKPSQLTKEEFEIMKLHPAYGRDAIIAAESTLDEKDDFLTFAKEIIYSHHEKWDGSGYPQGLKGDEIPVPARLMALADVYDALISRRSYKPPYPHNVAVHFITKGRGSHFDPDITDAFLAVEQDFKAIAIKFTDSDEEAQALQEHVTDFSNYR
jgi:putative two-component system response regulator